MESIEQISHDLIARLKAFVQGVGAPGVVLGLSGGIDSALVSALAVLALGPERVRAVQLPSPYTSEQSFRDSDELCRRLGIPPLRIPIQGVLEALTLRVEPGIQTVESAMGYHCSERNRMLAHDNLQARTRGQILMWISNRTGWLLLNTSNRSEILVGYTTLYGDACGAVAVLGSLYKTEVYALSRHINAHHGDPIPEEIILRPPTAELHPGQKDQDALPPYERLDPILQALTEPGDRTSLREAAVREFGEEEVCSVERLMARNAFKRQQLPPVL